MARQNLENEELGGVIREKINNNFSELYQAVDDIKFEPSVAPTISSDFEKNEHKLYEQYGLEPKSITQMYDVVRASTATYVDATGKIRTAGVNEPRIDYSSGQGRLLVEEQRTNLLTWSEDFSNNSWAKTNGLIVNTTTIQGVVEGTTFFEVIDDSDTLDKNLRRIETISANTLGVTQWAILKKGTSDRIGCRLALTGGTAVFGAVDYEFSTDTIYNTTVHTVFRIKLASDTVLFGMTCINNGTNTTADVRFYPRSSASQTNTGSAYINVAQLEQASTPSSYIPTEASAVTRAADNLTRVLGDEFNASEGTMYAEFYKTGTAPDGRQYAVACLGSNTGSVSFTGLNFGWTNPLNNRHYVSFRKDGTAIVTIDLGVLDNYKTHKILVTFKDSIVKGYVNGVLAGTASASDVIEFSSQILKIAESASNPNWRNMIGIGDFKLYPRALSEQEVIELTKV